MKKKIDKNNIIRLIKLNYHQVILVVVAFAIMVLVSIFYVGEIVANQMYDISEQIMNTTQTAVSDALEASGLLFSDVVRSTEKMVSEEKSNEEILDYLESVQEYYHKDTNPGTPLTEFMKIYGFIGAEFLDGSEWVPPADYRPRERPWYIGAVANYGELFFSEPYEDADTGDICISFSRVISGEGALDPDVLAIDLDLSRITSHIRNQQISNKGYGMLISDMFTFATHENEELLGKAMTAAGGDYAKLQALLERGDQISALRFTDYDGTDSIAFFRTLFNGWYIGIITSRASYLRPVTNLALVISLVGLLLAVALSFLLVRTRIQKLKSQEESLSKSSFLARMSHEMRTPMNAIIGMTEIARGTKDPEKMEYCMDKINDASKHLLGVINDVLDMSKIEAGKLELSPSDFVLAEMLDQVKTVINFKVEEKHQHFEIEIGKDVPAAIVADSQRLSQVITNLLSNACKFTPDGGHISLGVRRLANPEPNCTLFFEVTDDGIGISKENQAKLFRSFEQADGSISRKYGGTGLGLSISKRIVGLMGGEIWVESEENYGSRFSFTIDAEIGTARPKPAVTAETTKPADDRMIFKGKRLLLAEDVDINREILVALLDDTGIDIECAANGKEALGMFAADPDRYDMIFMDIHMPEMDGLEATRQIRALPDAWAKRIPIVAMTANVFKEDVDKCIAAGMNAHTGKPIELRDVIDKIEHYTSSVVNSEKDKKG